MTDIWGVLMRKDCPLAARPTIRPQDLLGLPLLVSNQHLVKNEFSGWFGEGYEKLNITTTYNLLYNASIMVEEGMGYVSGQDRQDIRRQPAVLQAAGAEAGSGVAYRLEKVPVFLEGR